MWPAAGHTSTRQVVRQLVASNQVIYFFFFFETRGLIYK